MITALFSFFREKSWFSAEPSLESQPINSSVEKYFYIMFIFFCSSSLSKSPTSTKYKQQKLGKVKYYQRSLLFLFELKKTRLMHNTSSTQSNKTNSSALVTERWPRRVQLRAKPKLVLNFFQLIVHPKRNADWWRRKIKSNWTIKKLSCSCWVAVFCQLSISFKGGQKDSVRPSEMGLATKKIYQNHQIRKFYT